jgi:hypothetical protein
VIIKHRFTCHGKCPVNGDKDVYDVTVWLDRTEEALELAKRVQKILSKPMFQESFTQLVKDTIPNVRKVKTVGKHRHVRTVVVVR